MMLVDHYVSASEIEGVGLFAGCDIQEGQKVYEFDYRFVMVLSLAEVREMPGPMRKAILKYSYRGIGRDRLTGAVYYCADDSRFFNHSDNPNTKWIEGEECYVATRFIPAGTEITCDYGEFSELDDAVNEFLG